MNKHLTALYTLGVISAKDKERFHKLAAKMANNSNFAHLMAICEKYVSRWLKELKEYGYSRSCGYSRELISSLKRGFEICLGYPSDSNSVKQSFDTVNHTSGSVKQSFNRETLGYFEKQDKRLTDYKRSQHKMNVKSEILAVIEMCDKSLSVLMSRRSSEAIKSIIENARSLICEVKAAVGDVIDLGSMAAMKKSNAIFDKISEATLILINGNMSNTAVPTIIKEAKKIAEEWGAHKLSRFSLKASVPKLKTVADISPDIYCLSYLPENIAQIDDVWEMIGESEARIAENRRFVDELSKEHSKNVAEIERIQDDISLTSASYQSGEIGASVARSKILDLESKEKQCSDECEALMARIAETRALADSWENSCLRMRTIFGNISAFKTIPEVLYEICAEIDFRSIRTFLSGTGNTMDIERVCSIRKVAAIIANHMRISAARAEEMLNTLDGITAQNLRGNMPHTQSNNATNDADVSDEDFMKAYTAKLSSKHSGVGMNGTTAGKGNGSASEGGSKSDIVNTNTNSNGNGSGGFGVGTDDI